MSGSLERGPRVAEPHPKAPKSTGIPLAFDEQPAVFDHGLQRTPPRYIDRVEWMLTEEGLHLYVYGGETVEEEIEIPPEKLMAYANWLGKPIDEILADESAFPTRPPDEELRPSA